MESSRTTHKGEEYMAESSPLRRRQFSLLALLALLALDVTPTIAQEPAKNNGGGPPVRAIDPGPPATQGFVTRLTFSAPDFEWFHPSGGATPNHIWVTGDYWAQNFNAIGIGAADAMALNLFIDDNSLNAGTALNMKVLLNGTQVGTFTLNPGVSGNTPFNFAFAPIAGPNYRIQLEATNTIPPLQGSVSMSAGGSSYADMSEVTVSVVGTTWGRVKALLR
jgi:hypothetical protein